MGYCGVDILAIDPGRKTGWAIIRAGYLHSCGLVYLGEFNEPIDPRGDFPVSPLSGSYHLIVEQPEVYQREGKCDPNDMIELGIKVGRIREYFGLCSPEKVVPKVWKGSTDKDAHNRRTLLELLPAERQIADIVLMPLAESYRNNVIDAIALGKWYAKKRGISFAKRTIGMGR